MQCTYAELLVKQIAKAKHQKRMFLSINPVEDRATPSSKNDYLVARERLYVLAAELAHHLEDCGECEQHRMDMLLEEQKNHNHL